MKTVLAIDDSEAMLNMVKQTLEFGGYRVLTAENGSAGLEQFRNGNPELIVTDINMPVMDGLALIKAVRGVNTEVPILTLTTEFEETMKSSGFEAGANGWIVKPFVPAQFLDIVKQIMD